MKYSLLRDTFCQTYKKGKPIESYPSLFRQNDLLNHVKQSQYDEDDGNNDQNMDPTTKLWESWTDSPTKETEQPKNKQDNNNCPQHKISPFE